MFPRSLPKIVLAISPIVSAADYQIEANIRYGKYAENVLDIVQSSAPALTNRPGVIVIHGGGWREGEKENMLQDFCIPFVQHDFVVANLEYRLSKAATAPAAVNDVLEAAHWVHDHAARFKLDPNQLVVIGDSAGGHLALLLAMVPASADLGPSTKIAAAINFYGISDVADQLEGPHQRDYAVEWIPEQSGRLDLARKLSPLSYVRKGVPPILSIHGDADQVVPYEQSVQLTKALKSAGADAELITVAGGQHGFQPAEMSKLWPQIFKWLKKRKIGG